MAHQICSTLPNFHGGLHLVASPSLRVDQRGSVSLSFSVLAAHPKLVNFAYQHGRNSPIGSRTLPLRLWICMEPRAFCSKGAHEAIRAGRGSLMVDVNGWGMCCTPRLTMGAFLVPDAATCSGQSTRRRATSGAGAWSQLQRRKGRPGHVITSTSLLCQSMGSHNPDVLHKKLVTHPT
jgi:hypothetical protein